MKFLINSNLFIAFGGALMALQTHLLTDLAPGPGPAVFLIFFATFFEYNIHRLLTILINPVALADPKHAWVKNNRTLFYGICFISAAGFGFALILAEWKTIQLLLPFGLITFFYSVPIGNRRGFLLRLREIPFLKIFLISSVWAGITLLLPQAEKGIDFGGVKSWLIFAERFLFIFSITLPFDIRDKEQDRKRGLITFPVRFGERFSIRLALVALTASTLLCAVHYGISKQWFALTAFVLSGLVTGFFLLSKKIREKKFYHYGFLDGTIIIQSVLLYVAYFFIQS